MLKKALVCGFLLFKSWAVTSQENDVDLRPYLKELSQLIEQEFDRGQCRKTPCDAQEFRNRLADKTLPNASHVLRLWQVTAQLEPDRRVQFWTREIYTDLAPHLERDSSPLSKALKTWLILDRSLKLLNGSHTQAETLNLYAEVQYWAFQALQFKEVLRLKEVINEEIGLLSEVRLRLAAARVRRVLGDGDLAHSLALMALTSRAFGKIDAINSLAYQLEKEWAWRQLHEIADTANEPYTQKTIELVAQRDLQSESELSRLLKQREALLKLWLSEDKSLIEAPALADSLTLPRWKSLKAKKSI